MRSAFSSYFRIEALNADEEDSSRVRQEYLPREVVLIIIINRFEIVRNFRLGKSV